MSIENRVGDLFSQPDVNVFAHQANIFCTFGAGIAKFIRETYPEAYEADLAYKGGKGDKNKLGTYSNTVLKENGNIILNCYTQVGLGAKDRDTSYDLIDRLFRDIEKKLRARNEANASQAGQKEMVLGIPYQYGSGLAGGDWRIVNAIFTSIFQKSPVKLVIVRLPSVPEIPL